MPLSRRVFLSLVGSVPLFRWLAPAEAAIPPAQARPDDVVVVKGWVLRRDDLEHLPLS